MTSVCYQADLCSSVVIKYEYFKTPRAAEAALKCYGCHGSQITEDIRPLDDSFRNPTSADSKAITAHTWGWPLFNRPAQNAIRAATAG